MQLPNVCSNSTLWSLGNDRDTYLAPHEFGQKAPFQGNSVGDGSLRKSVSTRDFSYIAVPTGPTLALEPSMPKLSDQGPIPAI